MQRILIIQTAFLGDVVLATPLIEKLREFYPEAKLDFLLRKGNEGLLTGHPKLTNLIIWDKQASKYKGLFRLAHQIRKTQYDLVVNCHRFGSSGYLTMLSGAKHRVGFDKNPMSFSFTKKVSHQISNGKHEVERNLELIHDFTDDNMVCPRLYPTNSDYDKVKPLQSQPYVCIAPASVWFTKQLPVAKWLELIETLDKDSQVYLLGAPNDKNLCAEIASQSQRSCANLAGELSLLQTAALMEKATMNYTNDSAPMHIASAMNAPTRAVFCSTVPSFGFGPLSDDSTVIETQEKLSCRPCGLHGKKECPEGHFKCATEIEF